MALLDRFRRRAIRDHATAGAFIDEQSFHLAENCVRTIPGCAPATAPTRCLPTSFAAALDKACWEAYPRALAMVGTVAEAALRPYAGDNAHAMLFGLIAMILEHFDQRPVPPRDRRRRMARGAGRTRTLAQRSRAGAAEDRRGGRADHSSFYLAIMPLHPKLGADNFAALSSQLKLALLQIQEAFAQRANLPALANELAGASRRSKRTKRHRPRRIGPSGRHTRPASASFDASQCARH